MALNNDLAAIDYDAMEKLAIQHRTCPTCGNKNLAITDHSHPELVAEYGFRIAIHECTRCGYEAEWKYHVSGIPQVVECRVIDPGEVRNGIQGETEKMLRSMTRRLNVIADDKSLTLAQRQDNAGAILITVIHQLGKTQPEWLMKDIRALLDAHNRTRS